MVAPLRSASVPSLPRLSSRVKRPRGGEERFRDFPNQAALPFGKRAQNRRRSDGCVRDRDRKDHQPAGARDSALAATVECNRTPAQSCIEIALPGREPVSTVGNEIYLALLAHHEASERA